MEAGQQAAELEIAAAAASAAAAAATPRHRSSVCLCCTNPDGTAGLLALTDELLLKVLQSVGAPSVAQLATLNSRLRAAQAQLAALPAFASAAHIEDPAPTDL